MRIPIDWAKEQFRLLGRRDAHDLAVDLLAVYEGSALLANTLYDPDISYPGRRVSSTAGSTHCDWLALVVRPVKLWSQSGPGTDNLRMAAQHGSPTAQAGRIGDRRVTKSAAGLIAPPYVQRVSVRKGLELPCL
jgi:hypothetical protein